LKNVDKDSCSQLFESNFSILHDDFRDIWIDEVHFWRKRISGESAKNALEALDTCNEDALPNVSCF
jgi:hypothetical protein